MAIEFMVTQAGLAALVGGTVTITAVGLTTTAFVMAPTLDVVPLELKRLDAVSGEVLSDTLIHMTAQDASTDIYDLRGLGLYLDDDTLFACYSQADPIFSKVSIATFLLALDITFPTGGATEIQFGDTNFLLPPATEDRKGVAEIATEDEASAGTDDTRIITPLKLALVIEALLELLGGEFASLTEALALLQARTITGGGLVSGGGNLSANRVLTVTGASTAEINTGTATNRAITPFGLFSALATRLISGGGLVTGGGDMTASRTLTVSPALAADVAAGVATDKAVTPAALSGLARSLAANGYAVLPGTGGLILQWGQFTAAANSLSSTLFPLAFPAACFAVVPAGGSNGGVDSKDNPPVLLASTITLTGFSVWSADDTSASQRYIAIGI